LAEITTNPEGERLGRIRSYVFNRVESRQLKPKTAKTFPFDDVVEA
jgi:hypothetical protein